MSDKPIETTNAEFLLSLAEQCREVHQYTSAPEDVKRIKRYQDKRLRAIAASLDGVRVSEREKLVAMCECGGFPVRDCSDTYEWVKCGDCGAEGEPFFTFNEALAAWNRRVADRLRTAIGEKP